MDLLEIEQDRGFTCQDSFTEALAEMLGVEPAQVRSRPQALLRADWFPTPLGDMISISDDHQLYMLEFVGRKSLDKNLRRVSDRFGGAIGVGTSDVAKRTKQQIDAYFSGDSKGFNLPMHWHGPDFSKQVWQALCQIPAGRTRSYQALAMQIGRPTAVRAVANANANNKFAIIVPCHRVIGVNGAMTGYASGVWRKQYLIELEQQAPKGLSTPRAH